METSNLHSSMWKSWDYFLLEQKNNVLMKETEKPKGDEAKAKKTEQGVDGLTFWLYRSYWYVSCYVRYHWCILFLVGGEGVGEGEGDDERFQYGPTTNLSNEIFQEYFYLFSF